MSSYTVKGLSPAIFEDLRGRTAEQLAQEGIIVESVTECPGYPCRVTLEDVPVGAEVLLLNFKHLDVDSPFRSLGPIFVRRDLAFPSGSSDELPSMLMSRLLSIRSFDEQGMMVDADVVNGGDADSTIRHMFEDEQTSYIHIHFAKRGCYACRVDRA